MSASRAELLHSVSKSSLKTNVPNFRPGDTVRVHARIVEGNKERIQIFEGVVIKRHKGTGANATFTVRKVSYNVGVERTFFLHSPRVDKIELVSHGQVRRSRLYYLRNIRGKASRIKSTQAEEESQIPEAASSPNSENATESKKSNGKKSSNDSKNGSSKSKEAAPASEELQAAVQE